MNLAERLVRSKNIRGAQYGEIPCKNDPEQLVALRSNDHLRIEPIWEVPVDELEGPLYQDYIKDNPNYHHVYVRATVARLLDQAARDLPHGLQLVIRAGHRPAEVQLKLLQSLIADYKLKHPSVTQNQALKYARTYVSDPVVKTPPHCCGAAVDVDVLDTLSGELIDFGCPVNTDAEISFLHSDQISKSQSNNRQILLNAMLKVGFASCESEWWHFSYGSQEWAHFYQKPESLYGMIEPNL